MDVKIIVSLRFMNWVENLVPIRNENVEIRLCVDFRNINRCSLKGNNHLPKMDHIIQRVVGAKRISMIDGFLGYNEVAVHDGDKEKTTFTTPWGTFMYVRMPFGLMNVGEVFQRDMGIDFVGGKDMFIVICLDDITIFSQSYEEYISHLKQTF